MKGLTALVLAVAVASPVAGVVVRDPAERAVLTAAVPQEPATEGLDALTARVAASEDAASKLRATYRAAQDTETALTLDLALRREENARLLAALMSFGRIPAFAAHPDGPFAAARALGIWGAIEPALRAKADALADQLREIAAARTVQSEATAALEVSLEDLSAARAHLISRLDTLAGGPATPAVLLVAARNTETLSALADRVSERTRAAGDAEPGGLHWPVRARVLSPFRAPDAAGVERPGLVLEAAPLALVTAPGDGIVRYAGPFLDYGYVLVVELAEGDLLTLAGFARLDAVTGQSVTAGEALGFLGGAEPSAQEYLMLGQGQSDETQGETLYIELRRRQGSVDPLPWFTARNG